MKAVTIQPKKLRGEISILPSKSVAHRMIISAALAKGASRIYPVELSDDIAATIDAVQSLGLAKCDFNNGVLTVTGGYGMKDGAVVDCNESGSTLRFLLPLPLVFGKGAVFTGRGRLMERPQSPYIDLFTKKGTHVKQTETSIEVSGKIGPGDFELPGNVSSQFITGLMFALSQLGGDSRILLKSFLESKSYVTLTQEALNIFGVNCGWSDERTMVVLGNQLFLPRDAKVPADWSYAALFAAAGALGGDVTLKGLNPDDAQGDKIICHVLERMGASVRWENGGLHVTGDRLSGTEFDGRDNPDIVPLIAVATAGAYGYSRIKRIGRLRLKESDRLSAITEGLLALGGRVRSGKDWIETDGRGVIRGGEVDAFSDHRIAMALTLASCICKEPVVMTGWQSVSKSAPHFWDDFFALGGELDG